MRDRHLLKAVAEYIIAEGSDKDIALERIKKMLVGFDLSDQERQVETMARELLQELGCPWNLKGHDRLVSAMTLTALDPTMAQGITKQLYPEVAKQFGENSWQTERNIRTAVEEIFMRGNLMGIHSYFGAGTDVEKGKLTNKAFIIRTAQIIRQRAGIGV